MASIIPLVLAFPLPSLVSASPEPRPLTWSKRSYGPDGPWQAVQVQFSSPGQPIDAYPGGVWESLLFSPDICSFPESGATCFAQQAGDGTFYFHTLTMLGTDLIPNFALPNLTTLLVSRGYRTLPNGTVYSAAVGNIALGAQASNMSFSSGSSSINGSLLTGYLADHEIFRIVGPVSAQSYSQNGFPIDLLDISIGVAVGKSPFNTSSVTGLLARGNTTCHAIAAWLPVTYNPGLGLYLWNTQDPLYRRIVASPAYLGFTFRLNNAAVQNMTIKVPFELLNLSLTEPLANAPTPYFPCSLPTLPEYRLGRSFLQAAFSGVNWMTDNHGVWFLAQAPGPNIASQPRVRSIGPLDNSLQQSQQIWEDTWQGIWAPFEENGEQPTPTPTASPTPTPQESAPRPDTPGPPIALIAGVTVGVLALAAIALGIFFLRRRKKRKTDLIQTSGSFRRLQ
ncbi:aspartic-type endopeptidase-like protein [Coniochaeta sp. 2T2.1]|nr:aspartic-type endopeptidase-like protein [Coniochaeta sp. 2T2.1]